MNNYLCEACAVPSGEVLDLYEVTSDCQLNAMGAARELFEKERAEKTGPVKIVCVRV